MANIEKIVLPDNTEYEVHDANALPLSAGSSYPLTDDLYLNKGASAIGSIGTISRSGSSNVNVITIDCAPNNGTDKARLFVNDLGQAGIETTNGIYLRPNNTTAKQTVIDTNGVMTVNGGATINGVTNANGNIIMGSGAEVYGGYGITGHSSGTISKSVAANTSWAIDSIAAPSGRTQCLQILTLNFVTATAQTIQVSVNGASISPYFQALPNSTQYISISGVTGQTAAASIRPLSAAITVTYWKFDVIWF